MKVSQSRKYITAFYMLGFFVGVLYANVISREYLTSSGIFSEYFLSRYASIEVIAEEYILYILRVRLLPLLVIMILGQTKIRKAATVSALAWFGFSSGILLVSAIVQMGVKGILLCVLGITPQFIFYILAYSVLLWYIYTYPVSGWNMGKTIFVILTMAIGMIMEVYVNPILMKMFIKAI